MSSQKRLVLFLVLSFVMMYGTQAILDRMGLVPKNAPPAPAQNAANPAVAQADGAPPPPADPGKPGEIKAAPAPAAVAAPPKARKPEPPAAKPGELVIGSTEENDPKAYHLKVELDQNGAGVFQLDSARYDGETVDGVPDRKTRLHLIQGDPLARGPASFSMTLMPDGKAVADGAFPVGEIPLDSVRWEVVRDRSDGPAARAVSKATPDGSGQVEGQEIAFRTVLEDPALTITKRYRIYKGEDGFEFDLTFASDKEAAVSYRLFGPHGIPIEGEWYTSTFRDVFFGQIKGAATEIVTRTAADVAKARPAETFETLPLRFAGVENQYFAVFLEPEGTDARLTSKAMAYVAREDVKAPQKSDVGVEVASQPRLLIRPDRPLTHTYKVFAGAKIHDALVPYGAAELATYRKNQWFSIPFASTLAQSVIAPLLDRMYGLTEQVARIFGFKKGSYGVAIILLTMTVRLCLFPLGRKQALISKKMQDLQPHLAAIKEKFKDDKERVTKETLALYREHGFNPAAGCLPALIQLPIFVGLWQALNNSVALRHSTFLYIKNLAAPDMMFSFGADLPLVGGYFNLLPIISVGLFMLQMKMFTPAPMTEEAKAQQNMMKFMPIIMGFMFYRVPSGLGLYFITSNLWQMGERLILPKITKSRAVAAADDSGGPAATLLPAPPKPAGGANGWLSRKLEALLEQANNERTIRNNPGEKPGNNGLERNRNRPRPGRRR